MQCSGLMPPHNPAAEAPQDVYNIEDSIFNLFSIKLIYLLDLNYFGPFINTDMWTAASYIHSLTMICLVISLGEFKVLKKAAKVFTKATAADISRWREEKRYMTQWGIVCKKFCLVFTKCSCYVIVPRYPEYCLQHIHLLPTKDPQKSLKAAMLLYTSFLIKMHNMSPKALEKEGTHPVQCLCTCTIINYFYQNKSGTFCTNVCGIDDQLQRIRKKNDGTCMLLCTVCG